MRERERRMLGEKEEWPDRPRLIANITSPLGATTTALLVFLAPPLSMSPLVPPARLTCAAFTRPSVWPAPCLAVFDVDLSCGILSYLISYIYHIYIPVFMCPLSAVLVLALPLSSTSSSWNPFSAVPFWHFHSLCTYTTYVQRWLIDFNGVSVTAEVAKSTHSLYISYHCKSMSPVKCFSNELNVLNDLRI